MKKIIFFFLFLNLNFLLAQPDWPHIEIQYNRSNNALRVEYDECNDPCVQESAAFCDREDCVDTCMERFQSGDIVGLTALINCIEGCGTPVGGQAIRQPIQYIYTVVAAWNTIPFHPWNNDDDWQVFSSSGPLLVNGQGEINIPDFNLATPWPNDYWGYNTCYGIGISVLYDDGNICDFTEWDCNIIG
jgi:hypothetical protein